MLDQLRFRAAWEKSGLQPGSDDAIRTLSANAITTPDDQTGSGVSIGSIGNSLLEPEKSTEIEVGFDAEFAGGPSRTRVHLLRQADRRGSGRRPAGALARCERVPLDQYRRGREHGLRG